MGLISSAKDFAMSAGGGSVIGAGAGLAGGALSAKASAKQAKRQMDFQERMSNTAFQRAATDLEKAGLNRILALGSPASTPAGAMGQVPDFGSSMASGAQAGVATASGAQSIQKQKIEIDKIIQETSILSEKEKQEIEKSKLWQIMGPIMQDAGKNFSSLLDMTTELAPKVFEAAVKSSTAAYEAIKSLISDRYNQSRQSISDWMDRAQEQWIRIQKHNPRNQK